MARNPKSTTSETDGIRTVAPDAPPPSSTTRELKGPGVQHWSEGLEVSGMFMGLRGVTTKFGDSELVDFEFAGGKRVTFGAPTVLGQRLRDVMPGHSVTVRCLGKKNLDNGQTAWQFKVWTDGEEA